MFELDFMRNAFIAGGIISILCPFIGLFLVLRRYSMIGDTLSHSSFAGVAIGLVIGVNPLITAFLLYYLIIDSFTVNGTVELVAFIIY